MHTRAQCLIARGLRLAAAGYRFGFKVSFGIVCGVGFGVLVLSGCALLNSQTTTSQTPAGIQESSSPAPTTQTPPTPRPSSSSGSTTSPSRTGSPGAEATAVEAMGLFARPQLPERRWFTDLLPYLSPGYAEEAQYIAPARIPFDQVQQNPISSQEEHNPQLVTVVFTTNDGPWRLILSQSGPGARWLVEAIEPVPAQETDPKPTAQTATVQTMTARAFLDSDPAQ